MRTTIGLLTVIVCVLLTAPSIEAATEPAVVTRANQKWREAHCTIRIAVPLKKGKNSEGWTRSPIFGVGFVPVSTPIGTHMNAGTAKGERPFYYTMEVSDRDALAPLLSGNAIQPGTRFIAEGWFLSQPEKPAGPYLQLRFEAMPQVKARFWFLPRGSFGGADSFPIAQFEPVERYLRIEAFKLEAADERLTEVAAVTVPAAPAAVQAPAPAVASTPFKPSVRMLAVSSQPAQVRAGDEMEIVLTYVVEGIPPGTSFEVVERREILRGEAVTGTFDKPLGREAGTFTSKQRVRIPASAPAALYHVHGTVTMVGISSSSTALLEVLGQ